MPRQTRQGKEPVVYPSEALMAALGRTLGVPVFQEQITQISMIAAGFTPGEADGLRRTMAGLEKMGRPRSLLVEARRRHELARLLARQRTKAVVPVRPLMAVQRNPQREIEWVSTQPK